MAKIVAILNVIAWSGFWAFGYLALSAEPAQSGQMVISALLAALGGGTGMIAYLYLMRHADPRRPRTPNSTPEEV
ncbi:MAG: hypothetical protein CML02_00640 [Pseudooceanicola sp.]|jgi:drug/metabolite transporter (DMT)-like permease|nr:hypothetical protein [Pseudooceanicola sp.]|tara:strand:+ start:474 stop:698 length:225 start_codon:yes stop_codon:yes gene_type:complete